MQIINTTALITLNATLFAQVVSFLILLLILNRVMIRPLRGMIHQREDYISDLMRDISHAEGEMEGILEQIKERESSAREEAIQIKAEAEKSGDQKAEEILKASMYEISEIKTKADEDIAQQISGAKKHLQKESETIAAKIMEKILDRRLAA